MPLLSRAMRFLSIKPIVGFVEGDLKLLAQARTFSVAVKRMEQRIVELGPLESLAVLHARRKGDAEIVAERLGHSTGLEGSILFGETGAVLSSHTGPGAIGMIGVQKEAGA